MISSRKPSLALFVSQVRTEHNVMEPVTDTASKCSASVVCLRLLTHTLIVQAGRGMWLGARRGSHFGLQLYIAWAFAPAKADCVLPQCDCTAAASRRAHRAHNVPRPQQQDAPRLPQLVAGRCRSPERLQGVYCQLQPPVLLSSGAWLSQQASKRADLLGTAGRPGARWVL